jgi:hypothetical protein
MQTAFVPNAGNALKLVENVTTVIVTHRANWACSVCILELFELKRIVQAPNLTEFL